MKRILLLAGSLLMAGCAALMNSDRPAYHGPIAKAVWHNSDVRVDAQPLIHNGMVYAVGAPWEDTTARGVFAFRLTDGASVWTSKVSGKAILLAAGSALIVADAAGGTRLLDLKNGTEIAPTAPLSMAHATLDAGVIYSVNEGALEARVASALQAKARWQSNLPAKLKPSSAPVVAGGRVFLAGYYPFDLETVTPEYSGIYAYDTKTGVAKWKWEPGTRANYSVDGLAADGEQVYVWVIDKSGGVTGNGILLALDAATGAEKWRHTSSSYPGPFGAPVLLDGSLVLSCEYPQGKEATARDSGLVYQAFQRATGEKVWESRTGWKYDVGIAYNDLLLISDHKIHEVLTENNNDSPDSWVSAVSLRTGKELWRSPEAELGVFTVSAAGEGMMVVGSSPFVWESPPRAGKREVSGLWAWKLTP